VIVNWTKMRVREFDKLYARKEWMADVFVGVTPAHMISVAVAPRGQVLGVRRGDTLRLAL
jgi:hypothetical protein